MWLLNIDESVYFFILSESPSLIILYLLEWRMMTYAFSVDFFLTNWGLNWKLSFHNIASEVGSRRYCDSFNCLNHFIHYSTVKLMFDQIIYCGWRKNLHYRNANKFAVCQYVNSSNYYTLPPANKVSRDISESLCCLVSATPP